MERKTAAFAIQVVVGVSIGLYSASFGPFTKDSWLAIGALVALFLCGRLVAMLSAAPSPPAEGEKWRPISDPPVVPCPVLYWLPDAWPINADGTPYNATTLGEDYRYELGRWDGKRFLEQGTNHDILDEAADDTRCMPTYFRPLPPPPKEAATHAD